MDDEKNKFSCKKHLDKAFDDFLVENETFPNLCESKKHLCSYCNEDAEYKLEIKK